MIRFSVLRSTDAVVRGLTETFGVCGLGVPSSRREDADGQQGEDLAGRCWKVKPEHGSLIGLQPAHV